MLLMVIIREAKIYSYIFMLFYKGHIFIITTLGFF